MSIEGGKTQVKTRSIQTQLADIDSNLDKYFSNYNIEQLADLLRDAELKHKIVDVNSDDAVSKNITSNYKKNDYFELIEICNELWIINGLINELIHEEQFEAKTNRYVKLRSKVNNLKNGSMGNSFDLESVKITNELVKKIDELGLELSITAKNKLNQYLKFGDNLELLYTYVIDNLLFSDFLNLCDKIENIDSDNFFNFNKIFNAWVIDLLDILQGDQIVNYSVTTASMSLCIDRCEISLLNYLKSVEQIILFFNDFINKNNSVAGFKNTRIIIGKILLKSLKAKIFLKENVYPLIIDKLNYEDAHANNDNSVSAIAKLNKISILLSQEGWSKDGICELEFWIDDLASSWIDNLVDCTIDDLKCFVISLMNNEKESVLKEENLISKEIYGSLHKTGQNNVASTRDSAENDKWSNDWEDNDDWNDDDEAGDNTVKNLNHVKTNDENMVDDGGWDDDDLDLDVDSNNEDDKTTEAQNTDDIDDDDWGAWDEEVNVDEDIDGRDAHITSRNLDMKKKLNIYSSKPHLPSYKYSQLVDEVISIFDTYMRNFQDMSRLVEVKDDQIKDADHLFKHGLKKLCISYFMMLACNASKVYQNVILFYNDYNSILEICYTKYEVDLTSCFKMSSNSIGNFMSSYSSELLKVIDDYNISIWNDNNYDDDNQLQNDAEEFLLIFENKFDHIREGLIQLESLNTQLVTNTFVTIIFKSFNVICERILMRKEISSYESEILSDLIDRLVGQIVTKTKNMNIVIERIQSFNKLYQTKLILSSSLKDILGLFYDAKLFELETSELLALIQSLFVDSPQRTQAMMEIQNARDSTVQF